MSLKSILSYSFQSFYLAGSFLLLFIFLPTFYNLSIGISLSVIGLVILISRFFDVFSDFLIGYLTEKRIISGRSRKNQILLGIIIFIFSLFGLYVFQSSNIYYFIFFYNLALISYSIAIIPYETLVCRCPRGHMFFIFASQALPFAWLLAPRVAQNRPQDVSKIALDSLRRPQKNSRGAPGEESVSASADTRRP